MGCHGCWLPLNATAEGSCHMKSFQFEIIRPRSSNVTFLYFLSWWPVISKSGAALFSRFHLLNVFLGTT